MILEANSIYQKKKSTLNGQATGVSEAVKLHSSQHDAQAMISTIVPAHNVGKRPVFKTMPTMIPTSRATTSLLHKNLLATATLAVRVSHHTAEAVDMI